MLLMMHCDFEKGSQNQHFQSTLGRGSGGVGEQKEYSDKVDNSGRPNRRLIGI